MTIFSGLFDIFAKLERSSKGSQNCLTQKRTKKRERAREMVEGGLRITHRQRGGKTDDIVNYENIT